MASKSPEATIDFLLTAIDSVDGKIDWKDVAKKTGWYKSGKFSKQAFDNIKKKYAGTVIGTPVDQIVPAGRLQLLKRKAAAKDSDDEGDADDRVQTKGLGRRATVSAGGRQGKKMKTEADMDVIKDEDEDGSSDGFKVEEA